MTRTTVIGGGILAFLLLCVLCSTCHGPAIQQALLPPLGESSLLASITDGKVDLQGVVPSDAVRTDLVAKAKSVYGEGNVQDHLTVNSRVADASWMPSPALGLFGLLKGGVKHASFTEEHNELTVTGVVKNDDAKKKLLADAAAAAPALTLVDRVDVEAAAVEKNIGQFLEGKTIEFKTGSAELLPHSKAILDTIAMLLKEAPDASIEVAGFTDNVGAAASNLLLSQRRAGATKEYLLGQGIPGKRMTPVGYGADRPVAGNNTPEGRQRNRRIQFILK